MRLSITCLLEKKGKSFSTQLLDDTAARRVMFSLARKKYEHMVSVDGIAKFEDDD